MYKKPVRGGVNIRQVAMPYQHSIKRKDWSSAWRLFLNVVIIGQFHFAFLEFSSTSTKRVFVHSYSFGNFISLPVNNSFS